jgi:membrane-bound lytic murein transglycosylase MltF
MLFNRYLKSARFVNNALAQEEMARFNTMVGYFRKYADRYDFNWLILAALGYQESQLDQTKRSAAGAIGVMQLLPSTAADSNVAIDGIEELEPNIHAGVKYLDFLHQRYFSDPQIETVDQWLLTFAAYNAGPARVRQLRALAAKMELDPNRWFGNVEIAAAREIGRETVQYVSNIYKYYIAYKLAFDKQSEKRTLRESLR